MTWHVFVPDPWVWEGWMFDALRDGGCEVELGASADDPSVEPLSASGMAARLANVDGLLLHSREAVPAGALTGADRLRVIAKMGIGVERIDVPAATRAGIVVTNTPVEENFQGIAEGTVTLLLALLKELPAKERQLREGRWRDRATAGHLLTGRTVGLVGLGRVGSTVAHLLRGWPVRLVAHDPNLSDASIAGRGADPLSFHELLATAHVVSLHAARPGGEPPLMDAAAFSRMRPGAFLINTARGGLVNEAALVAALASGHVAGAALDVFAREPLAPDHPLREAENVILTPHSIGTSRASQTAICRAAVECCLAALRGREPRYVVNRDVLPVWRDRLARLDAHAAAG